MSQACFDFQHKIGKSKMNALSSVCYCEGVTDDTLASGLGCYLMGAQLFLTNLQMGSIATDTGWASDEQTTYFEARSCDFDWSVFIDINRQSAVFCKTIALSEIWIERAFLIFLSPVFHLYLYLYLYLQIVIIVLLIVFEIKISICSQHYNCICICIKVRVCISIYVYFICFCR